MKRFLTPSQSAKAAKGEDGAVVALESRSSSEEEDLPSSSSSRTPHQVAAEHIFPARKEAPVAAKQENELWVDKYAPQTYADLVGLGTYVNKMEEWLRNWDAYHLYHTKKTTGSGAPPPPKAVLLSGPPGIGKSTLARLVSTKMGREIFELNASDTRSKKLVEERLQDVVQTGVMSFAPGSRTGGGGRVVIMDEVDGMSSSDRGGVQELIRVIKTSRCPIICICNDHSKPSVRSLANHCLDLKLHRPHLASVLKRAREICAKERVHIDDAALEAIIVSSGNDIRQVINALQMFHHSPSNKTGVELGEINKDAVQRLSAYDACSFLFGASRTAPLAKRNEAFFADYDLIPLMIGQNYVAAVQNSSDAAMRDEMAKMQALTRAADAVCDADVVARIVRADQRWDLLTNMAMLNIRVAYLANGPVGHPNFPEWLGKNSNASRRARLLAELCTHVKQSTGTLDRTSLRLDYVTALRQALLKPLALGETEAVLDLLDEYGMSRDDFFETLRELQFPDAPPHFRDEFKGISSHNKTAFTRAYNKRPHMHQLLVGEELATTMTRGKKKRAKVVEDGLEGEGEGEEEMLEEEEEEGEDNVDAFRAKKSSKAPARKSSSSTKAKKAKV